MIIKNRDSVMYAPHVLFAMFCLLLVFAVMTYVVSGSILTTVFRTAISSICLQTIYCVVVLHFVLRRAKERRAMLTQNREPDEAPHAPATSHKNADL
ncbi:exopolysaccharide production repressor exox [Rhizobium sp.]|uniref:exopolysaccharide production repressor exox n=1 Tax=Rhizobium sp. TaxID=391 RepID=UPI002AA92610